MGYKDRLQESIQLTSPDGNVFQAAWRGDDRSLEKKLGVFNYPNVDGSDVQDLGTNGISYPLTFYFSGQDNDLEANRFFESCKERGTWEIVHPVRGVLNLNLISVTEKTQPVTSGNVTEVNTTWIEPLNENAVRSSAQIASEVTSQSDQVNQQSSTQYDESVSLDNASESIANEQMVDSTVQEVDNNLGDIISQNDDISAEVTAIKTGITDSLSQTINAISLAGQIQQLIQLPVLATTSIQARVTAYSSFVTSILGYEPDANRPEDKNTAAVMEVSTSSALIAMSESIITGELETRTEAIELIETITDTFNTITNTLDNVQELFSSNTIDTQYFSNSQSYSDLLRLVGLTVLYLLRSSLDLKIEKRFTLDRQRNPIEVTVTEYGSLGEDDENLDFFTATNKLFGTEIRLLPAGFEAVVYL